MRRLQVADADTMCLALRNEIARSEESRYDHRLHGVLLVCSGMSCYQVAELMGHSPRTLEQWVTRFTSRGLTGLQEKTRPGRPAALNKDQIAAIAADLRRSPREFGFDQTLWDGKLLSHHLASTYKAPLGVRQCQRLFSSLGFRRRKPRPVIAKADPEAQRAYKKTPESGPSQ